VAIKILPESCAGGKNRVARFKKEVKVLATLNHPNIAVIYGIEKTDEPNARRGVPGLPQADCRSLELAEVVPSVENRETINE
jgi:serine/threonine protein kinase